jgi:hypothetical protein
LSLVACARQTQTDGPFEIQSAPDVGGVQVSVVATDFEVGQPRIPLVFYQGADRVADIQSVTLTAFDLATEPPSPGWTGQAVNYSDYEVPYWVVYPELPHAGRWGLGGEITLADGTVTKGEVVIEALEHSSSPPVGSQAPASENRTLATEPDIHLLSSGDDPILGLYQITVAEALESGRPTVVTLATPRYCTSQICAPVVGSIEAVYADLGDEVNFIHLEIFKDFETLDYADEVEEWGLVSEPWTFVIDAEGTITASLAGPLSPRELTESLEPVLP